MRTLRLLTLFCLLLLTLPAHADTFTGKVVGVSDGEASTVARLPYWSAELGIDADTYYGEKLPEALELAALELERTFDAIVVDEGQDFSRRWLTALQSLVRDPNEDTFYVFFDPQIGEFVRHHGCERRYRLDHDNRLPFFCRFPSTRDSVLQEAGREWEWEVPSMRRLQSRKPNEAGQPLQHAEH